MLPIAFFAAVLPKYIFFGTDRFEKTQEKVATSLPLPLLGLGLGLRARARTGGRVKVANPNLSPDPEPSPSPSPNPIQVATSLLLPSAFAFGADILADYEYAQVGVTSANLYEGEFSFAGVMSMMLFDSLLYLLLFLYLDRVLPSKYGARAHPLFCLRPSYWRGGDDAHG